MFTHRRGHLLSIDNLSPVVVGRQHYGCFVHHLVGVAEIAEMLGVSRQRVNAIVKSQATFPEPQAELSAGRIWLRSEVVAWAKSQGRHLFTEGRS